MVDVNGLGAYAVIHQGILQTCVSSGPALAGQLQSPDRDLQAPALSRRDQSGSVQAFLQGSPSVSKARSVIVQDPKAMQTTLVSGDDLQRAKTMLLRQVPLSEASVDRIAVQFFRVAGNNQRDGAKQRLPSGSRVGSVPRGAARVILGQLVRGLRYPAGVLAGHCAQIQAPFPRSEPDRGFSVATCKAVSRLSSQ